MLNKYINISFTTQEKVTIDFLFLFNQNYLKVYN